MRIPSGSTDRYVYFVAVDPGDLSTRETGLTAFTVYASLNGGTAAAFTTPTVNETDSTNMPGVYELLLDESTTLTAGHDTEELCLHITQASMEPVTRVVEIYRPETTEGNTHDVTSTGAGGIDWGNVENQSTSVDLSATAINLVDTATALTTNNDKTGYALTQAFPTNFADMAITVTTGYVTAGTVNDKTGYSLSQTFPTNFADLSITPSTGLVDVNDKTGFSLTQAFPTNFADLAITVTTGQVTVGTNNDKTGYTASTVTDKTGYSISGTITTLDGLQNFDPATDTVANVTTVGSVSGAVASVTADVGITAAAVDNIWDENIVSAHGTASSAGLLLRALGAAISTRSNNATLNALLGVTDAASKTISTQILVDTTFSEPGQVAPLAENALYVQGVLGQIHKFSVRKIDNDGTDIQVYNDAGSVVDQTAPVAEAAGTVTRSEVVSGP
jgi:hypothetical protein